jgi:hypothetical protein
MTIFQLDQCLNDRRLADRCNRASQGQAQAFRFPNRLHDAPDPVVLAALLPRGNPFISTDRAMPEEHACHIHNPHAGIVIICHSPDEPRTMTSALAAAILARFKTAVPCWHSLPLANSIMFLTEIDVEVCHVGAGKLVQGRHLPYTDTTWAEKMVADLQANAARFALPPTAPGLLGLSQGGS